MFTLVLVLLVGLLAYALYRGVTWEKLAAFGTAIVAAIGAGDWSGAWALITGLF